MPPKVSKQSVRTVAQRPSSNGSGSAWDLVDTIRMLLYGRSGTGKTTLWATFPGPILALVCSGGNKPGELRSINTPEYREKIHPVVVRSIEDLPAVLEGAGDYATVVLDHVSGLSDMILQGILGLDEMPPQKSWGLASQQQYGQLAMQLKTILRDMLNLPGNVIIIAQEKATGEESGSDIVTPTVGAALTPSVAGWLYPSCDYIVETFIRPVMEPVTRKVGNTSVTTTQRGKGVEYCLRTAPHDVYITKFRVPKGTELPEVIVDPDYDKILSLTRGEV